MTRGGCGRRAAPRPPRVGWSGRTFVRARAILGGHVGEEDRRPTADPVREELRAFAFVAPKIRTSRREVPVGRATWRC